MRSTIVGIACISALTACGAATESQGLDVDEDAAADQVEPAGEAGEASGDELGVLEQGLNEATCGTATVNRNSRVTAVGNLAPVRPPYGSASCTNAFLQGFNATTPKSMEVSMFSQISANQADCARTAFHAIYFANGSRVGAVDGVSVFRGGTSCVISVLAKFDPAARAVSVSGNKLTIPGGVPPAAANARFALQALNAAGALQTLNVEITKFQ
jgi:hypothetical protein